MLRVLLIAASVLVVYAQDATTVKATTAKPTPEPNEVEKFHFMYEQHTHKMTLSVGDACYVFTLSEGERSVVHTTYGLRALEMKLLGSIATATTKEVQRADLNNRIAVSCGRGHFNHYYVVLDSVK